MKLQHLTVIFVIIVLPITLILSAYTGAQIDILTLQNQYDEMLLTATYDGIKAFQINASYNSLSNVSDALREDVESAVSAFMQSLAVKMGVGGYNINHMKTYVPAILFTLYDGYYIYAPAKTTNEKNETVYEYMLKPYNYYTVRYKNESGSKDVVINYTLDNYIVVYGWLDGTYVVNSGYLVSNDRRSNIEGNETLYEYAPFKYTAGSGDIIYPTYKNITEMNLKAIKITDDKYNPANTSGRENETYLYPRNDNYYVDSASAKLYYDKAVGTPEKEGFTKWVTDNLDWITADMAMRNADYLKKLSTENNDIDYDEFTTQKYIFRFNTTDNDPEDSASIFAQHKTAVIRSSIQDNLNQSITAYSQGNASSYEYKLPKLDINEWDMVSNNVCMLTFLQGIPMKTKYYNNYALVQSTRNNLYVSPDSLYFVTVDEYGKSTDDYYHKIDCPYLGQKGGTITGYSNFDFLPKKLNLKDENDKTYYKHYEQACYYCIVDSANYIEPKDKEKWKEDPNRSRAYYTALAREKYRRYTATGHLNNVT